MTLLEMRLVTLEQKVGQLSALCTQMMGAILVLNEKGIINDDEMREAIKNANTKSTSPVPPKRVVVLEEASCCPTGLIIGGEDSRQEIVPPITDSGIGR